MYVDCTEALIFHRNVQGIIVPPDATAQCIICQVTTVITLPAALSNVLEQVLCHFKRPYNQKSMGRYASMAWLINCIASGRDYLSFPPGSVLLMMQALVSVLLM